MSSENKWKEEVVEVTSAEPKVTTERLPLAWAGEGGRRGTLCVHRTAEVLLKDMVSVVFIFGSM